MLDIQQKRKVRGFMYHRATSAVLFVIVLFALHSTWSVYKKKIDSEELKAISVSQVDLLKKRETDLISKIDKLATVYGVEEEIRSKFSVAKEGESMVVIVPDDKQKASSTSQKEGIWYIIKNLFNN
ncbi:MAG: hypothetical protein ABL917_02875 [Parcubacteria group bacterium]